MSEEKKPREFWANWMSMYDNKRDAESFCSRGEREDLRSYVETKEYDKLLAANKVLLQKLDEHEKAYAPDIFPPVTEEELKKYGYILTKHAATMGRHMIFCFRKYIEESLAEAAKILEGK